MLAISSFKKTVLVIIALVTIIASCNKELPRAIPIGGEPSHGNDPTIAMILDGPNYSILKSAAIKAGLMPMFADKSLHLTLFAPDNAAMAGSRISQAVVNSLPAEQVAALVMYHTVPQALTAGKIPTSFPNLQYPSIFNPAPSVSPLFRLTTFPSKRGNNVWVNNIPVIEADISAVNGVVHKVARVVAPPSQYLWQRISTDPNLTYLKAAITRADSGKTAANSLQGFLLNIGANFTVFAPTDAAFKATLTGAITQALIPLVTQQLINAGYSPTDAAATAPILAGGQATVFASTPDVFKNPLLFSALTAQVVQGILVYHILGSRAFSVNLPTSATAVPTLLNGGIPAHPGVTVAATFGPAGVTAATVKGVGNAAASNILINSLPGGTSDQHYLNGALHFIDQVLLPQ